ncbi:hypothetical protein E8D34_12510 [Nocardioides sp. GY 10113]|uniref:hypothetical protein n=1 Tax=Nocardioides sp. GY 10113 TaxID=2569761 RepID=UPI0010A82B32|nr:hypothetical protein [Nocardioides sp. GY 10113]TIC85916.1 hypothetical protein E8D34_12510 [Nocardioides sp. GY 10113]
MVDSSATFNATGFVSASAFDFTIDDRPAGIATSLPATYDVSGLTEGVHTVRLDVNGLSASTTIVVDHSPPTLTVAPTDGGEGDPAFYPEVRPPYWDIVVSDSASAVTVRCTITSAAGYHSGDACSAGTPYHPTLSFGSWVLAVTATDEAGHTTTVTRSFTYQRHPDAPVIDGATLTGPAASFAFASRVPGVTYECRLEGKAWQPCTSPAAYTGVADGGHTFWVRSILPDTTTGLTNTFGFTVDGTKPAFLANRFSAAPAELVGADDAPLTWRWLQVEPHPATTECSLTPTGAEPDWQPCGRSAVLTPTAGSGPYHFRVRAIDLVGNVGTLEDTFEYDVTPPTIAVSPPERRATRKRSFAIAPDEPLTTQECRMDRGEWSPCGATLVLTGITDGHHTLTVRGTDRVALTATASRRFYVDGTAPFVAFRGHATRTMELHGRRSGVKEVAMRSDEPAVLHCSLNRGEWRRCGGSARRPVTDATVRFRVGPGTHDLRAYGVDRFGNRGSVSRLRWRVRR